MNNKLKVLSVAILSIVISSLLSLGYSQKALAYSTDDDKKKKALIEENRNLNEILSNIFPRENKVMYENPYRMYDDMKPKIKSYSLNEVVSKGKDVKFKFLVKDFIYKRPIYTSSWKDASFRGWLQLPDKVSEARHRLFVYPGGLSAQFDFEGSLGLDKSASIDYHRNLNIVVYNFNVESIKEYKNQIALIGKPSRSGIQIISIVQDDLLPKGVKEDQYLLQLSTPKGYEVDFIYSGVINYEYLKEIIKKNSVGSAAFNELKELKEENLRLKNELRYYIPVGNNILITSEKCRGDLQAFSEGEIEKARNEGKEINFETKYKNITYVRPIYDPMWKENYKLGWAWIPSKACEAMHNVFIVPDNLQDRKNLFGSLGFNESYKEIMKAEKGILIYNFDVEGVKVFNNQIIINGVPARTGASLISISKNDLTEGRNYNIQLISPDNLEVDYDVLRQ